MALDGNGIAYGVTRLVRPRGTHKATIVWLHDIGENGDDSARFVRELNLPNIKWICPTAPRRPVSRLGGAVTTAWCDVTQVSENMEDDLASINTTCVLVTNLLAGEPAHVMKGVGGIGLGAAQGLYFASGYVAGGMGDMALNAVVGINGWLPAWTNFLYHIDSLTVSGTLAASLPILLTNENSMVPFQFGWLSEQSLSRAGIPVTFRPNDGSKTSLCFGFSFHLTLFSETDFGGYAKYVQEGSYSYWKLAQNIPPALGLTLEFS
ncbi:acyl-protein thioesterase 2-like isoform X2 [Brassica rapa]|uniref:acyl-protein thioesterase 2-like isoform X2 n=1 Tax=Brassica campestris TaxID=3711 RepID=UPI00142E6836|nr:acyl-protein thioesterase 2-like isoform X2 [Brassica rapa]